MMLHIDHYITEIRYFVLLLCHLVTCSLLHYCVNLSYDITSGREIMPCNKINKPLVLYRFSGNVMTSITLLHT